MELADFYVLQKVLDEKVNKRVAADYDTNSYYAVEDVIYAFHTEVHELSNEVGFFKYWKHSHTVDKEATIEELADCIHFLLKLALIKGYDRVVKRVEPFPLWEEYPMIELFSEIRRNNLDSIGRYELAFSLILGIAKKLGYSDDDVDFAYRAKNIKNLKRQNESY